MRIGFDGASGTLCGGALCLLLALAAWLWARGQSGMLPPLLSAVFLIGAFACFFGAARQCKAQDNLADLLQGAALASALLAGASLLGAAFGGIGPLFPGKALLHLGAWTAYGIAAALWLERGAKAHFAGRVRNFGASALKLAALTFAVLGGVSANNPWWGMAPALAPGLPLLNPLLLGYAIPAALLGYVALRGREVRDDWLARLSLGAGLVLGGLWAVLEIRRAITGPDLTRAAQPHLGALLGLAGALALIIGLSVLAYWAIRRRSLRLPATIPDEAAPALWRPSTSALALRPNLARARRGPETEPRVPSRDKRAIDPNLAPPV